MTRTADTRSETDVLGEGARNQVASPECLAILQARLPLEKMVGYARGQVAFYEPLVANEFARQELAFNRTLLTDAVNNLAAFDVERLTDEARERLAAFSMDHVPVVALVTKHIISRRKAPEELLTSIMQAAQ